MFRALKLLVCAVAAVLLATTAASAQVLERQPTMWLVTVGVSEFSQPNYAVNVNGQVETVDLRNGVRFAAKDAEDLAAALQTQQGRLYRQVVRKTLTNSQATKQDVLKAMKWLREQPIQAEDVVVVFLAGHGANEGYAPFDDDHTVQGLVTWSSIQDVLAELPGTRMLILDTCHSNRAAELSNPKVITLAACMYVSREDPALRNGLFTRALIEALEGRADSNKDGVVSLSELYAYVSNRLDELTRGEQLPTAFHSPSVPLRLRFALVGSQPVANGLVTTTPPQNTSAAIVTTTPPPRPEIQLTGTIPPQR